MSSLTGTWSEVLFVDASDFTAVASTSSEASLIAGINEQPMLPARFFCNPNLPRRAVRLHARGIFSNTGTPTMIFQARASSTQGSATLSGASLGVSAAITTGSGVSNQLWELLLDIYCKTPGLGTSNMTLTCAGWVQSAGFAAPYFYPLEPTTPDTATWTQTIDGNLDQYLNLSLTWSASSSSNTAKVKQLLLLGLN